MHIRHNVSLKAYNTFGIDVNAKLFCTISSTSQLAKILKKNNPTKSLTKKKKKKKKKTRR